MIHVLDPDEEGPFFGKNALAALMAEGGPLAGLDIVFDHRSYDWDTSAALEVLVCCGRRDRAARFTASIAPPFGTH